MAQALLGYQLASRGVRGTVSSAGIYKDGQPASPHAVTVVGRMGLDLSQHRSRVVTAELLRSADLILGMERMHVREAVVLANDVAPGNALTLTVQSSEVTEVFSRCGQKGVTAENVASAAIDEAREYLASSAAVGIHLADQLLLPMALAGGGSFTTVAVTEHFRSHAAVIETFLERRVTTPAQEGCVGVTIR